ncbi:MAG: FRG domain-containing protein [bacterium]|nr:FRG domain-containing protein [bacterium]
MTETDTSKTGSAFDVELLGRITGRPIQTVADLIDLEEHLTSEPGDPNAPRWCFRGQPQVYGNLTPSFQRQFQREAIGAAEIIERRLVEAFREHYGQLGDRSREMPHPPRIDDRFTLRCLSVMQHYEIPTRLLDWSSSFWTSVYFACASHERDEAEFWFYDRRIFDSQVNSLDYSSLLSDSMNPAEEPQILGARSECLVLELDPKITPRMVEQDAHHTVATDVFSDHAPLLYQRRREFHEMWADAEPAFQRRKIDGACKGKALQFLAEEKNITASTIFPDVVGLGRFLRWQFDSLRTMLL